MGRVDAAPAGRELVQRDIREETVSVRGTEYPRNDVYPTPEGYVPRFSRKKDQTLAKPALIPWAARSERDAVLRFLGTERGAEYLKYAGDQFGRYKNNNPHFAYEALRDTAGDAGSTTHTWIEWWISGRQGLEPECEGPSEVARRSMQQWFEAVTLVPKYIETAVHLLPSEFPPDGMGGRLDCFAEVDIPDTAPQHSHDCLTGPVLLDWKTSAGIYPDFTLQVAFYGYALHKREGTPWPVPGVIVRPPKTEVEFTKRGGWPEVKVIPPARMERAWVAVRAMQNLYTFLQEEG